MRLAAWACACATLVSASQQLAQVVVVTRHGVRVPDDCAVTRSCLAAVTSHTSNAARFRDFAAVFGATPGELTAEGLAQCRRAGAFLRARYAGRGVPSDYATHARDVAFLSPNEVQLQRCAMAVAQGLFPNDAVPITLLGADDTVLAAPPQPCDEATRYGMERWLVTNGSALIRATRGAGALLAAVERACNMTGLSQDPLDASDVAQIGAAGAFFAALPERAASQLSSAEADALAQLSAALEQRAVAEPANAVMLAGDLPAFVLQRVVRNGKPVKPRLSVITCSGDALLALAAVLDVRVAAPPGASLVFELWENATVRIVYVANALEAPVVVGDVPVDSLAARVSDAEQRAGGDWRTLCGASSAGMDRAWSASHWGLRPSWAAFLASLVVRGVLLCGRTDPRGQLTFVVIRCGWCRPRSGYERL